MNSGSGAFDFVLANFEIAVLLYFACGVLSGVFMYRLFKRLLFRDFCTIPTVRSKQSDIMLDFTLFAINICYVTAFGWLMYCCRFTMGYVRLEPIDLTMFGGPAVFWPNPSEYTVRLHSASLFAFPIGDLPTHTAFLFPLGFAVMCAFDIRRLPTWLKLLSVLSIAYVVIKFVSFYVRSAYEPVVFYDYYPFGFFAQIDLLVFNGFHLLLFGVILYIAYKVAKSERSNRRRKSPRVAKEVKA